MRYGIFVNISEMTGYVNIIDVYKEDELIDKVEFYRPTNIREFIDKYITLLEPNDELTVKMIYDYE